MRTAFAVLAATFTLPLVAINIVAADRPGPAGEVGTIESGKVAKR